MHFARITTDKKTAGKVVWIVFAFCTLITELMGHFSGWPAWINAVPLVNIVIVTLFTFGTKRFATLQSVLMMLFSYGNIFVASVAEGDIYLSLPVILGAAIVLVAYRDTRLLAAYLLLQIAGLLFHIFALGTVPLGTPLEIIEFIVRTSILTVSQVFLIVVVSGMNVNRDRMLESIEEARRAERYKSDFLANMSHEIRTPMNAIIGMCELILRERELSDSVRENCFNIRASGRSLLSIINDILDFSKIESGNMELIKSEFNVASVLNDVINMSEARKQGKNLELLVSVQPDIPRSLIGDEVRIRQIMVNLMTNAIKFTERGSVTLSVSHEKQDYGCNLIVSVADTGIGITEENIEKLFTSFRQVNTRKNRSVEGTGLGLAICKQLVRQMGGFISVKSEYGKGSEFRFVIPLMIADGRPFVSVKRPQEVYAAACFGEGDIARRLTRAFQKMGGRLGVAIRYVDNAAQLRELCAEETFTHLFVSSGEYAADSAFFASLAGVTRVFVIRDRSETLPLPEGIKPVYKPFYVIPAVSALNNESIVLNLGERRGSDVHFVAPKARVLIVDDNVINLKVSTGLMQPYGMQVVTAQSGAEAVAKVKSEHFDLVFMDHMMAGMDGVEATAIIRETEGEYYQNLPIVALTANAVNGAREMFMGAGFNDFLAKPIELSALDRVLRSYLPRQYMQPPVKAYFGKYDRRVTGEKPEGEFPLLDTDKGLSYMGGDELAYREILSLYVESSEEKIPLLRELHAKKDAALYAIEVHALKSASLSIGSAGLSEAARELEAIARSGSLQGTDEKNSLLLAQYAEVAAAVRRYLELSAQPEQEDEPGENEPGFAADGPLSEIAPSALGEFIERAKAALSGFDSELLAQIAQEARPFALEGEPVGETFSRAARLAKDFEYEKAERALARLQERLQAAGKNA